MDNQITFVEDLNRMFEERSCLKAQLEAVENDLIKQLRACGFSDIAISNLIGCCKSVDLDLNYRGM